MSRDGPARTAASFSSGRPAFSVVIPAYDRERTIGRAIESALAQRRAPEEVLVVDDGSRDRTVAEVERFAGVRLVRQANGGASAARNRGVEEARHPWIAFLDSDDYWEPEHLARMESAIFDTGGQAGLYFSDMRRGPARGSERLWDVSGFRPAAPFELVVDATDWAVRPIQPMMLQASVFRRDVYRDLGGLSVGLACRHDTHLFFKACIGRPACAVSGLGTVQTDDDQSGVRVTTAFGSRSASYWEETLLLYEDVLERLPASAPRARGEIRARIAGAHLRLLRHAWQQGAPGVAASHLLRAARTSPQRVLWGRRRSRASSETASA